MKTLEQWTKEIDEGIAMGLADFENGNYYTLDDNFISDIKREVMEERKLKDKNIFLVSNKIEEGILV